MGGELMWRVWCSNRVAAQPVGSVSLRLIFLSWLPLSSWLRAGSGLLQEAQYIEYALRGSKQVLEAAAWAAIVSQEFVS